MILMKTNATKEIKFLKLEKKDGQCFFEILKENFKYETIINQQFKTLYNSEYILLPLVENEDLIDKLAKMLERIINFKIISKKAILNPKYKYKTLIDALEGKIPLKYLKLIPKSYDIIGNIAIIELDKFSNEINRDLLNFKQIISNSIIELNNKVKSVYEKKSEIQGVYRLRQLELLHGEDKSITIHKENNCIFKLDVKKTYFTPRLVYERRRVATTRIKENEIIIDMFAGVGTFSIQIAKRNNVKIYAFDVNPYAFEYLKENIKLNKMKGDIIPSNMNIKNILNPLNQLGKLLHHKADRIIMNLPENSIEFIKEACFLMKSSRGILHFYQFSEKPNPIEKTIEDLKLNLKKQDWCIDKILVSKIVKSYSPKSDLVVVDSKIKALTTN